MKRLNAFDHFFDKKINGAQLRKSQIVNVNSMSKVILQLLELRKKNFGGHVIVDCIA